MQTVLAHIRAHLNLPPEKRGSLDELRKTQWSRLFEQCMRNRLIMGSIRYETLQAKQQSNHGYDMIGSAEERLTLYRKTGNMEHLVDVANLCLLEFECPSHRTPNWTTVDDGTHVKKS